MTVPLEHLVGRSRYAEKESLAAPRIIVHEHALACEGVILSNFVSISQHEHSISTYFDRHYQSHLKHLKLKGLQPKTVEAYSRAIRRICDYFGHQIEHLTEAQLTDYFSDLARIFHKGRRISFNPLI